jgi:hypothetical protein
VSLDPSKAVVSERRGSFLVSQKWVLKWGMVQVGAVWDSHFWDGSLKNAEESELGFQGLWGPNWIVSEGEVDAPSQPFELILAFPSFTQRQLMCPLWHGIGDRPIGVGSGVVYTWMAHPGGIVQESLGLGALIANILKVSTKDRVALDLGE